jgi:5-methylcytosine-specific restriction enzyme A
MGVRGEPTKWDKWYSTALRARIRRHQLREQLFCAFCLERGIVSAAEICDHVEPHHGDVNEYWLGPLHSLCKRCDDSMKQFVELHGFRPDISLDGWPLDPRHPIYNRGDERRGSKKARKSEQDGE